MRRPLFVVTIGCTIAFLLSAATAGAQQASGIAGLVRDASGAVLPGVTVEAASTALIEKTRSAVTDGEGRYSIVGLLPGNYAVTFALQGFRSQRREGIELTAGFTAAVNADLQVGALDETITVSGASPLVDTQNVRKQIVVSRDLLDSLPVSTKSQNAVITLTPGLTGMSDVAGSYSVQLGGTFHGKAGTKVQMDGMSIQNMQANGATGYAINAGTVEEITAAYAASNAEIASTLGRNLAACGTRTPCTATATVPLISPGTMREPRVTRVDLRVTKYFNLTQRLRVQGNVDVYNALNSSSILTIGTAYGSRWRQPTAIVDPRIVQFSAMLTF